MCGGRAGAVGPRERGRRDDPELDPDPTLPEDLDYESVQKKLRKYQRLAQRRQKAFDKQRQAIDEKQAYIGEQQAELVEMQAAADATKSAIHDFSTTMEELHRRSTELAAQRARNMDEKPVADTATTVPPEAGPQNLHRIARDLLAGAQHFDRQTPHVQHTMLQLLAVLDGMRQPHAPPQPANATALEQGQSTLAAAFARAPANGPAQSAPSPPTSSTTPIAAVTYEISDPPTSQREESAGQQPAPMEVAGQCLGDKRKRHDVLVAEAEAQTAMDEADKTIAVAQPPMEVRQLGTLLQPVGIGVAYEPALPQSRQQLLEALHSTNKQQARDRNIRTEAQRQKAWPY